jgi:hypothetical protein
MASYKFGKHPPKLDYRTLRFKSYLTPAVPPPPASHDVLSSRVYPSLKTHDAGAIFPMDGNDRLGDCTIAALAHADTVFEAMVGDRQIWPESQVVKLYDKLTGGADTGLAELDVLNYWHKHRAAGDKLRAFVSIDPKNHTHVKQAITLFGGVYLGFQVQAHCIEQFDRRKPWTPGPLTQDGHAVFAVGYDPQTVTVLTWGNTQQGTWEWWNECVDEAYALLAAQASDPAFAPGFNLAQLQMDLSALA